MAQATLTQQEFEAKSKLMIETLAGFIVETDGVKTITIDGKTYTVEGYGKRMMGLVGKRKAIYTVVSMPRCRVMGKPNAFAFSVVGSGGRDCGKFYILDGKIEGI